MWEGEGPGSVLRGASCLMLLGGSSQGQAGPGGRRLAEGQWPGWSRHGPAAAEPRLVVGRRPHLLGICVVCVVPGGAG